MLDENILDWTSKHFSKTKTSIPKVNIIEREDDFLFRVAAPGFTKTDFKIEFGNSELTISSEIDFKKIAKEEDKILRNEFCYKSFSRTFSITSLVQRDSINAKYTNGILEIIIPKAEEVKIKPTKTIEIS